jgi:hypothetical protein
VSYQTIEDSINDARPFWLYAFNDGVLSQPWLFTSDDEDIIIDTGPQAGIYTASPIDASDVEVNGNIERQDVDFTFPNSDAFARRYLDPAYAITTLTIFRGHHADPDMNLSVHWKGRLVGASSIGDGIKMSAESIFTSMRRIGNRARCERQCIRALYRPGCNLVRSDFEEAGTVTDVSGLVLTVPEAALAPDGDYTAGIVNFGGIFGMVQLHSGDQITLLTKIHGLADYVTANGSADVLLAPGCNRTLRRCVDRFSNNLNNGGYEKLPEINPFTSGVT